MMKHLSDLMTVVQIAVVWAFVFCAAAIVATSHGQAQTPTGPKMDPQSANEAIENLEELLGQYEQGQYANQPSGLAAAQARITELEMALGLLSKQHEDLQAEHAALQERCSQP